MSLLSAIFGFAVGTRNALYDRGVLKSHRLAGPVISVGNIRVGGAGKTPFVILVGELLKERGVAFDVLSRGYGRSTRGVALVDPRGTPDEFGDEPLLIARKLDVPVIVGEDRYSAGLYAEQRFGPQLHLLDDGFQHRRLARDYEIVLVTPTDLEDSLLPAGRLREPIESLRRADAIVLPAEAADSLLERIRALVPHVREANVGNSSANAASEGHEKLILRVCRSVRMPSLGDVPSRPVAFCAIARPEHFFADLQQAGVTPVAQIPFRDHHRYEGKDVGLLRSTSTELQGDGYMTTEKDAINLGDLAGSLHPLAVVPAIATLDNGDSALDHILATIAERRRLHTGTEHSPIHTR